MNQKLSDWASIAEIISGIAVLVTLVFLVLGVRDNTRSTQADTYQALMTELNRLDLAMLEDQSRVEAFFPPNTVEIWEESGIDGVLLTRIVARSMEAAFFSYRNGSLDDSQWERFRRNICDIRTYRSPTIWQSVSFILSVEFREYLDGAC